MAYAALNKSGCEERKGNVKVRLDFFLEPTDPRYSDTYLPILDPETEKPTGQYHLLPFHSHFVHFNPDVTVDDIKTEMEFHLANFYKAFQDRWDEVDGGMRHGWATEKRKRPRDYSKDALRVSECQAKVEELTKFSFKPKATEGKEFPATAIDVGAPAIDRASGLSTIRTYVEGSNTANQSGTIDTVEIWSSANMSTCKAASFYEVTSNKLSTRDYETLGAVTSGAKRTFTGLSIDIQTGDYIGEHHPDGKMEQAYSGGTHLWLGTPNQDRIPCTNTSFTFADTYIQSLYGTGETAGPEFVEGAAALSGAGTLAAAAKRTRTATATLSGAGTVAALATCTVPATASLSGAGTLTAVAQCFVSAAASLAGLGTVTAAATCTVPATATLSGAGTVSAAAKLTLPATATLSGQGTLAAIGQVGEIVEGAATLSGAGTLAAAAKLTLTTTATLSGQGTLAAIGQVGEIVEGAATLGGLGTLAAAGKRTRAAAATSSGAGTITALAQCFATAAASLSGAGTVTAAAKLTVTTSTSLSGVGTLSAAAKLTLPATATLSGQGTLAAAAKSGATFEGAATLSGAGTLAAAAKRTRTATASPAGTGTLAAIAYVAMTANAALTGAATLAAIAKCTKTFTTTLAAAGTIAASAVALDVTVALLAAQKARRRQPYVEVHINDLYQGVKRLSWGRLYDGSTPWRTPTGHNDPDTAWTDEANAYDDTDTTKAKKTGLVTGEWIPFLELTQDALMCNKVRFLLNNTDFDLVDVDVYYEGAWHDVYQGTYNAYPTWNEKNIPDGLKSVTKARLRARSTVTEPAHACWFHEFDFGVPAGLEADNHHGIAFDGNGDMHRIRVSGNTLYRQKITAPGPDSDYSQWTTITTDCAGPCAIAASGAKVYIFYRRNTVDEIAKYYSHDYGDNWTHTFMVTYTAVLSMAATWWGTSSTVICFALKSNAINGIRLDTTTQTANQHTKSFSSGVVITNTYGIGATYDPFWPECPILIAGRQSDTPYSHFNIFRTWFSDTWNFGALESLISSPDGEGFTFEYPDCHRPQPTAEPYEANRITLVEKFTGTSAYTRPVTCHQVPGTYWSDTAYTEPRPFLNTAPAYGLRIQTTTDYYWLSTPSGVWRAPRVLTAPLVLADDIVSVAADRPGSLVLELDNSDGRYASPGEGDLASLRFRAQIELRMGYRTATYGNLTATAGTFWIDAWQYSSDPNISRFTITAIDASELMRHWTPRFQLRWNQASSNRTVWQIMFRIIARIGIELTDSAWPKSSAIDNFYPDFTITPGTPGTRALNKLLTFVPDRLVMPGTYAFTKNPLASEATSYVYSPDIHQLLTGKFTHAVTTTWARAAGRDASDNRIVAHAFDWDDLADAIDILEIDYDPNLATAARLQERADAMLRLADLEATPATITAPPSLFAELLDVVDITDPRCRVDQDTYRIMALRADYQRRRHRYDQTLTLAAP